VAPVDALIKATIFYAAIPQIISGGDEAEEVGPESARLPYGLLVY